MNPTSLFSSSLPTLLLLLSLFHSGLQAPTTMPQDTTTDLKALSYTSLVSELESMLENISTSPELSSYSIDDDFRLKLWNTTLLKVNLCAFVNATENWNDAQIKKITKNLEGLLLHLPRATPPPMTDAIAINKDDLKDYYKKLQIFVKFLSGNQGLTPTSVTNSSPDEQETCKNLSM